MNGDWPVIPELGDFTVPVLVFCIGACLSLSFALVLPLVFWLIGDGPARVEGDEMEYTGSTGKH